MAKKSFEIIHPEELFKDFPQLEHSGFEPTSPATGQYNCIAFVMDDKKRKWWPASAPACHWPKGIPHDASLETFILAFGTRGFEVCENPQFEVGKVKIAIYGDTEVRHAAIQKGSWGGTWRSKLGSNVDIIHTLEAIENGIYGQVLGYMERRAGKWK